MPGDSTMITRGPIPATATASCVSSAHTIVARPTSPARWTVRDAARRRGLLLRASHWMLVLAPPLTISADEIDEIVAILGAALDDVVEAGPVPGVALGATVGS